MPIQLAIDGSPLCFPPSGTRTYLEALIGEFCQTASDLELVVLTEGGGISPWSALPGRARRVAWDLARVSAHAASANAELLHIPRFSYPMAAALPVIVTVHDLIPLRLPEYRRSKWSRAQVWSASRGLSRAVRLIAPSHVVSKEIVETFGIDPGKISVIPMGVSNAFKPATETDRDPVFLRKRGIPGPYIFNASGFDVRKNLDLLVRGFWIALPVLGSDWRLVIAGAPHTGNAAVYPPLQPLIRELGLEDRVILTGWISEADKIAFYQQASIYVTPSTYEGFGLTMLEAMACGIPVIGSDRTSLPEVAGGAAVLVEPDANELASAIANLAHNSDRAAQLRRLGIDRAAEFSWKRTAAETLAAYRLALT